jgi:hypothetical protein
MFLARRSAGRPTAECKGHLGCESAARRNARAEPMVSALAAVRSLLPRRIGRRGSDSELGAAFPVLKPIAMLAFRVGLAPAEGKRLSRHTIMSTSR